MIFDWDENKNIINISKHGIDFNDVIEAFDYEMLIRKDEREDYGEDRFIGIGKMLSIEIVIIWTKRADKIRIISAVKLIKKKGKSIMIKSTKTDWQRLSQRNDDEIDYSEIPESNANDWDNAELMTPHKKVDFTITIDEDLALWLKEKGDSSNQAVNNIIRAYYIVNA